MALAFEALRILEPVYYPGTILRVALTDFICSATRIPVIRRTWIRFGSPMAHVEYQEPSRWTRRIALTLLIMTLTAGTGMLLSLPAALQLGMEQNPRPMEWAALILGVSTCGSVIPQDPRIRIPLYAVVRMIIALSLIVGPLEILTAL